MLKYFAKQTNKLSSDSEIDTISIEAHPPERQDRAVIAGSVCCTSCCCCSCCIHSAGGLLGAVTANAIDLRAKNRSLVNGQKQQYISPDNNIAEQNRKIAVKRAMLIYWIVTGLITILSWLIGHDLSATFIIAMVLPGIQIVAGLFAIPIALALAPTDRRAAVISILKIMLGVFIGSTIGLIGMILFGIIVGAVIV